MPTAPELTADDLARYGRHVILPEVGVDGQRRLKGARVLCVGAGGLGSPVAMYLAAAGVGTLGLVDFDVVDVSNLQRQILHGTPDIGRPKTESARDRLRALNPLVSLELHPAALSAREALALLRQYDVVVDGTDNFPTRYLVNDACVLEGRPNVHASIHRFEGQLSVFGTKDGPCYRCLHPLPPPAGSVPDCAEGGVLGVLPGLLGTLQATEALKLLLGIGRSMAGRLLVVDTLTMAFREFAVERDGACTWCATRTSRELLEDYAAFCGAAESSVATSPTSVAGAAPPPAAAPAEIAPAALAMRLARRDPILLLDVREEWEHTIVHLDGATLVPMAAIPARAASLDRALEVVVYCHHGTRSAMVADYLRASGFPRVLNLTGGIDRWSREVDPSVPRY